MLRLTLLAIAIIASCSIVGCKRDSESPQKADPAAKPVEDGHQHSDSDGHDHSAHDGHDHDGHDGQDHDEHEGHDHASHGTGDGHGHGEEADLGTVEIGGMQVSAAQGHGKVAAGNESHIVIKLPYSDKGSTVVRAWLGTDDRTLSMVGKGEYAAKHDEYSVHAVAPRPLPPNVMWWIEIQKPNGTKAVGAIKPLLE